MKIEVLGDDFNCEAFHSKFKKFQHLSAHWWSDKSFLTLANATLFAELSAEFSTTVMRYHEFLQNAKPMVAQIPDLRATTRFGPEAFDEDSCQRAIDLDCKVRKKTEVVNLENIEITTGTQNGQLTMMFGSYAQDPDAEFNMEEFEPNENANHLPLALTKPAQRKPHNEDQPVDNGVLLVRFLVDEKVLIMLKKIFRARTFKRVKEGCVDKLKPDGVAEAFEYTKTISTDKDKDNVIKLGDMRGIFTQKRQIKLIDDFQTRSCLNIDTHIAYFRTAVANKDFSRCCYACGHHIVHGRFFVACTGNGGGDCTHVFCYACVVPGKVWAKGGKCHPYTLKCLECAIQIALGIKIAVGGASTVLRLQRQ